MRKVYLLSKSKEKEKYKKKIRDRYRVVFLEDDVDADVDADLVILPIEEEGITIEQQMYIDELKEGASLTMLSSKDILDDNFERVLDKELEKEKSLEKSRKQTNDDLDYGLEI